MPAGCIFTTYSAGMYKKFLNQSNLSGEEWASKVVDSVVKVQAVVAGIHSLVEDVKRMGEDDEEAARMLAEACRAVMDMALPPKRRRCSPCKCSITGASLAADEGLEILKRKDSASSSSTEKDIVVHPRFNHFFSMLWLACRLDHILRNMARAWMVTSAADVLHPENAESTSTSTILHEEKKEEVEGIGLCQRFSEHHAKRMESMGVMFQHAVGHVRRSLTDFLHA